MVYIAKKQLLTRIKRYKALNRLRMHKAMSLMGYNARLSLSIVPILLHYNHVNLVGYRPNAPCGIDNFTPNDEHWIYLERVMPDGVAIKPPKKNSILALYAMGSTSSIGQGVGSDLDLWVCTKSGLSAEELTLLQDKCHLISSYFKASGVELNLFVTPQDRFSNFQPDSLDEENCGSAQNFFLLDEFYRSSFRICGRYILWYLISSEEEEYDYHAYSQFLLKGITGISQNELDPSAVNVRRDISSQDSSASESAAESSSLESGFSLYPSGATLGVGSATSNWPYATGLDQYLGGSAVLTGLAPRGSSHGLPLSNAGAKSCLSEEQGVTADAASLSTAPASLNLLNSGPVHASQLPDPSAEILELYQPMDWQAWSHLHQAQEQQFVACATDTEDLGEQSASATEGIAANATGESFATGESADGAFTTTTSNTNHTADNSTVTSTSTSAISSSLSSADHGEALAEVHADMHAENQAAGHAQHAVGVSSYPASRAGASVIATNADSADVSTCISCTEAVASIGDNVATHTVVAGALDISPSLGEVGREVDGEGHISPASATASNLANGINSSVALAETKSSASTTDALEAIHSSNVSGVTASLDSSTHSLGQASQAIGAVGDKNSELIAQGDIATGATGSLGAFESSRNIGLGGVAESIGGASGAGKAGANDLATVDSALETGEHRNTASLASVAGVHQDIMAGANSDATSNVDSHLTPLANALDSQATLESGAATKSMDATTAVAASASLPLETDKPKNPQDYTESPELALYGGLDKEAFEQTRIDLTALYYEQDQRSKSGSGEAVKSGSSLAVAGAVQGQLSRLAVDTTALSQGTAYLAHPISHGALEEESLSAYGLVTLNLGEQPVDVQTVTTVRIATDCSTSDFTSLLGLIEPEWTEEPALEQVGATRTTTTTTTTSSSSSCESSSLELASKDSKQSREMEQGEAKVSKESGGKAGVQQLNQATATATTTTSTSTSATGRAAGPVVEDLSGVNLYQAWYTTACSLLNASLASSEYLDFDSVYLGKHYHGSLAHTGHNSLLHIVSSFLGVSHLQRKLSQSHMFKLLHNFYLSVFHTSSQSGLELVWPSSLVQDTEHTTYQHCSAQFKFEGSLGGSSSSSSSSCGGVSNLAGVDLHTAYPLIAYLPCTAFACVAPVSQVTHITQVAQKTGDTASYVLIIRYPLQEASVAVLDYKEQDKTSPYMQLSYKMSSSSMPLVHKDSGDIGSSGSRESSGLQPQGAFGVRSASDMGIPKQGAGAVNATALDPELMGESEQAYSCAYGSHYGSDYAYDYDTEQDYFDYDEDYVEPQNPDLFGWASLVEAEAAPEGGVDLNDIAGINSPSALTASYLTVADKERAKNPIKLPEPPKPRVHRHSRKSAKESGDYRIMRAHSRLSVHSMFGRFRSKSAGASFTLTPANVRNYALANNDEFLVEHDMYGQRYGERTSLDIQKHYGSLSVDAYDAAHNRRVDTTGHNDHYKHSWQYRSHYVQGMEQAGTKPPVTCRQGVEQTINQGRGQDTSKHGVNGTHGVNGDSVRLSSPQVHEGGVATAPTSPTASTVTAGKPQAKRRVLRGGGLFGPKVRHHEDELEEPLDDLDLEVKSNPADEVTQSLIYAEAQHTEAERCRMHAHGLKAAYAGSFAPIPLWQLGGMHCASSAHSVSDPDLGYALIAQQLLPVFINVNAPLQEYHQTILEGGLLLGDEPLKPSMSSGVFEPQFVTHGSIAQRSLSVMLGEDDPSVELVGFMALHPSSRSEFTQDSKYGLEALIEVSGAPCETYAVSSWHLHHTTMQVADSLAHTEQDTSLLNEYDLIAAQVSQIGQSGLVEQALSPSAGSTAADSGNANLILPPLDSTSPVQGATQSNPVTPALQASQGSLGTQQAEAHDSQSSTSAVSISSSTATTPTTANTAYEPQESMVQSEVGSPSQDNLVSVGTLEDMASSGDKSQEFRQLPLLGLPQLSALPAQVALQAQFLLQAQARNLSQSTGTLDPLEAVWGQLGDDFLGGSWTTQVHAGAWQNVHNINAFDGGYTGLFAGVAQYRDNPMQRAFNQALLGDTWNKVQPLEFGADVSSSAAANLAVAQSWSEGNGLVHAAMHLSHLLIPHGNQRRHKIYLNGEVLSGKATASEESDYLSADTSETNPSFGQNVVKAIGKLLALTSEQFSRQGEVEVAPAIMTPCVVEERFHMLTYAEVVKNNEHSVQQTPYVHTEDKATSAISVGGGQSAITETGSAPTTKSKSRLSFPFGSGDSASSLGLRLVEAVGATPSPFMHSMLGFGSFPFHDLSGKERDESGHVADIVAAADTGATLDTTALSSLTVVPSATTTQAISSNLTQGGVVLGQGSTLSGIGNPLQELSNLTTEQNLVTPSLDLRGPTLVTHPEDKWDDDEDSEDSLPADFAYDYDYDEYEDGNYQHGFDSSIEKEINLLENIKPYMHCQDDTERGMVMSAAYKHDFELVQDKPDSFDIELLRGDKSTHPLGYTSTSEEIRQRVALAKAAGLKGAVWAVSSSADTTVVGTVVEDFTQRTQNNQNTQSTLSVTDLNTQDTELNQELLYSLTGLIGEPSTAVNSSLLISGEQQAQSHRSKHLHIMGKVEGAQQNNILSAGELTVEQDFALDYSTVSVFDDTVNATRDDELVIPPEVRAQLVTDPFDIDFGVQVPTVGEYPNPCRHKHTSSATTTATDNVDTTAPAIARAESSQNSGLHIKQRTGESSDSCASQIIVNAESASSVADSAVEGSVSLVGSSNTTRLSSSQADAQDDLLETDVSLLSSIDYSHSHSPIPSESTSTNLGQELHQGSGTSTVTPSADHGEIVAVTIDERGNSLTDKISDTSQILVDTNTPVATATTAGADTGSDLGEAANLHAQNYASLQQAPLGQGQAQRQEQAQNQWVNWGNVLAGSKETVEAQWPSQLQPQPSEGLSYHLPRDGQAQTHGQSTGLGYSYNSSVDLSQITQGVQGFDHEYLSLSGPEYGHWSDQDTITVRDVNGKTTVTTLLDDEYEQLINKPEGKQRVKHSYSNVRRMTRKECIQAARNDHWQEFNAPLNEDEWFDFGSVSRCSPAEYFGSGLWLLYKAIDSPFKVVLKIILMEAYASEYTQNKLLSSELKDYMLSHDKYSLRLDSYFCMYARVASYLLRKKDYARLDLMRKCFYLKIFMGFNANLLFSNADFRKKRAMLNALIKSWGWTDEFVVDLERVDFWKMPQVRELHRDVYKALFTSYQALLRFSVEHGIEYAITSDDAGILSRKLYAAFDIYPGKILLMHKTFANSLEERNLTFIQSSKTSLCRRGWHLYNTLPDDIGLLNMKAMYIGSRLCEVVTWATLNGLLTSRTKSYVTGSIKHVTAHKIKRLSSDVKRILQPVLFRVSEASLQRTREMRRCLVLLNLDDDPTVDVHNRRLEVDVGSSLSSGRLHTCLIGSVDIVLVNSWGEVRTISFPAGEDGVVELLATLLRIIGNSMELSQEIAAQAALNAKDKKTLEQILDESEFDEENLSSKFLLARRKVGNLFSSFGRMMPNKSNADFLEDDDSYTVSISNDASYPQATINRHGGLISRELNPIYDSNFEDEEEEQDIESTASTASTEASKPASLVAVSAAETSSVPSANFAQVDNAATLAQTQLAPSDSASGFEISKAGLNATKAILGNESYHGNYKSQAQDSNLDSTNTDSSTELAGQSQNTPPHALGKLTAVSELEAGRVLQAAVQEVNKQDTTSKPRGHSRSVLRGRERTRSKHYPIRNDIQEQHGVQLQAILQQGAQGYPIAHTENNRDIYGHKTAQVNVASSQLSPVGQDEQSALSTSSAVDARAIHGSGRATVSHTGTEVSSHLNSQANQNLHGSLVERHGLISTQGHESRVAHEQAKHGQALAQSWTYDMAQVHIQSSGQEQGTNSSEQKPTQGNLDTATKDAQATVQGQDTALQQGQQGRQGANEANVATGTQKSSESGPKMTPVNTTSRIAINQNLQEEQQRKLDTESIINSIEVCCYAAAYSDAIKYDMRMTLRQVIGCLSSRNSSEYSFDVGSNKYVARSDGKRGVRIDCKRMFATEEFDMRVLSRYGMRPEFSMQVPPVVDRYATVGIVQYFFSWVAEKTWDIYIINERNEVAIYKNFVGSRAMLVNAINRFYTTETQIGEQEIGHFNLPQYFVLSRDQTALHPFTIRSVEDPNAKENKM